MLLSVHVANKSIGPKLLYEDLSFEIQEKEKVAIIGRNGVGKTTLFHILHGDDTDYTGKIEVKKDTKMVMTRQEYDDIGNISAFEYILDSVPQFHALKEIITTFPEKMQSDMHMITLYTDAIHQFSERGYYTIEDQIITSLESFSITLEKALSPLTSLSGGEKKYVELVKMMYASSNIVLIDEPTNHMDYIGKENFLMWFDNFKEAILVITHDRDVLEHADRILEIRDKGILSFPGNYDAYLKQNSLKNITNISQYESSVQAMDKLKKQVMLARQNKLSAKSTKAKIRARKLEERLQRQYDTLAQSTEKPSIWIDQDSLEHIDTKIIEKYEKYKDKNIQLHVQKEKVHSKELIRAENLSLGYEYPLFENMTFQVYAGEKLFLKGRNGAGKTTLLKTIIAHIQEKDTNVKVFHGDIVTANTIQLGIYEQEINPLYLSYTLRDAVRDVYFQKKNPISDQKVAAILAQYLFNPMIDGDILIQNLSGGQKARFQLIHMLCNTPNVLILDEPTNHLDLPSIEELEKALLAYHGAILYVSHDTHFIEHIGGKMIFLDKQKESR